MRRRSFTETVAVIDVVVSKPSAYEWIRAKAFVEDGSDEWLPYFSGGCHV
jgi:hypothetical protein